MVSCSDVQSMLPTSDTAAAVSHSGTGGAVVLAANTRTLEPVTAAW
jgi:hypothetical protein